MAEIEAFGALVGRWTTEATHPMIPGVVVHGEATIEWLEGQKFLIVRASNDHPQIPDSISIIGDTDGMAMHYFDSRGVYRIYPTAMTGKGWEFWRDHPGFMQRFVGRFEDGGDMIVGMSQLNEDDKGFADDLATTYRRVNP